MFKTVFEMSFITAKTRKKIKMNSVHVDSCIVFNFLFLLQMLLMKPKENNIYAIYVIKVTVFVLNSFSRGWG